MAKKSSVNLQPIESHERLYVRVARRIAGLVNDGQVKPGDKLPSERELAEMLEVSRPTVREAMIALEVSGLIEIRTGSGIYVLEQSQPFRLRDSGIGPFEILEMRLMVEPEACALAAVRATEQQLEELEKILADMTDSDHTPEVEQHDRRFHNAIARATENGALESTIKWLWDLREGAGLNRAFHQRILQEGIFPVLDDHTEIFQAIKARDAQAARENMRRHLNTATQAASSYFSSDKRS